MKTYRYDDSHLPDETTFHQKPIQSAGGSNTVFVVEPWTMCLYDDWRNREKKPVITEEQCRKFCEAIVPLKRAYRSLFLWLHLNLNSGEPIDDTIELCITLDPKLENYKTLQILLAAGVVKEVVS